MNDTLRMLLMQFVTVTITLGVAFGVSLNPEQSAGVVGFATVLINLIAYAWKGGQQIG